jgi:hypothetical protein
MIAAASGQTDQLTINNVRATYGLLGTERPDHKALLGDTYCVAFDIDGLKADDNGRVQYTLAMKATDSKGQVIFAESPEDLETYNTLGGSRVPAFTILDTGLAQNPGDCTIRVTVTDRTTRATRQLVHRLEIMPRSFGIIRLATSLDPELRFPAAPVGVPGQSLWVNFFTLGFQRDPANKLPNVRVEMRILDENGKPTLAKPVTGEISQAVPEATVVIPWQFRVSFNRAGKYTLEVRAADRVSKKAAKLSFPLVVVEQKANDSPH